MKRTRIIMLHNLREGNFSVLKDLKWLTTWLSAGRIFSCSIQGHHHIRNWHLHLHMCVLVSCLKNHTLFLISAPILTSELTGLTASVIFCHSTCFLLWVILLLRDAKQYISSGSNLLNQRLNFTPSVILLLACCYLRHVKRMNDQQLRFYMEMSWLGVGDWCQVVGMGTRFAHVSITHWPSFIKQALINLPKRMCVDISI